MSLNLTDVLRFHQREAAEASERARHPLNKYETRVAWEITVDIHRELAKAIEEAIEREKKS